MEINRENVVQIVRNSGLNPDKDYGQNFLVDPQIAKNIISLLEINDKDAVLEVGPGIGSLSHFISLEKCNKIDLVDIDERMINFLKIIYQDSKVELHLSDIRKYDVSKSTKIIGNLPYNITTELVIYLVENGVNADAFVLMCQAEAYNRFSDLSGKEYGPASILIHLLGDIKRCLTVKPGSFYPSPKCSSIVFKITIDKNQDRELAINVYKLAKKLFLNRRKTIHNNLSQLLNSKEKSLEILNKLSIPQSKRPEELSPNVYVDIFKQLQ